MSRRASLLTPEEVERRAPVWSALSGLFLDMELQSADFDHVAAAIAAAGYDRKSARAILDEEVAPVFAVNLLSVAGEWNGWSPEMVRGAVLAGLPRGRLSRWRARALARVTRPLYLGSWREVERRLSSPG